MLPTIERQIKSAVPFNHDKSERCFHFGASVVRTMVTINILDKSPSKESP